MIDIGKESLVEKQKSDFLLDDEKIVVQGIIHNAIYWKAGAVLVLALVLLIVAFNLGLFILLVSGIMFVTAYFTKMYMRLLLTNKRVIIRAGIAFVELTQLRHSQIESVELSWTMLGQMLGYASVVLSGTGQRVMVMPYVANAQEFRRGLEEILLARDDDR